MSISFKITKRDLLIFICMEGINRNKKGRGSFGLIPPMATYKGSMSAHQDEKMHIARCLTCYPNPATI